MSARDVDVLVIGAGLGGIGAAWHLQHERPGATFAILEARAAIGGTWDLFRFPGVRSDSDMHTLSLPYAPWRGTDSRAGEQRSASTCGRPQPHTASTRGSGSGAK